MDYTEAIVIIIGLIGVFFTLNRYSLPKKSHKSKDISYDQALEVKDQTILDLKKRCQSLSMRVYNIEKGPTNEIASSLESGDMSSIIGLYDLLPSWARALVPKSQAEELLKNPETLKVVQGLLQKYVKPKNQNIDKEVQEYINQGL
jgi:hypothetical protein